MICLQVTVLFLKVYCYHLRCFSIGDLHLLEIPTLRYWFSEISLLSLFVWGLKGQLETWVHLEILEKGRFSYLLDIIWQRYSCRWQDHLLLLHAMPINFLLHSNRNINSILLYQYFDVVVSYIFFINIVEVIVWFVLYLFLFFIDINECFQTFFF